MNFLILELDKIVGDQQTLTSERVAGRSNARSDHQPSHGILILVTQTSDIVRNPSTSLRFLSYTSLALHGEFAQLLHPFAAFSLTVLATSVLQEELIHCCQICF